MVRNRSVINADGSREPLDDHSKVFIPEDEVSMFEHPDANAEGTQCYSSCDVNWAMTIFTVAPLLLLLICICICICICCGMLKR